MIKFEKIEKHEFYYYNYLENYKSPCKNDDRNNHFKE